MTSCIYYHMDFGGGDNPCGYADVILLVVNDASAPGWSFPGYAQAHAEDDTMTSPAACQAKCAATDGCAYWSYELEDQGTVTTQGYTYHQVHECYLKADYTQANVPTGAQLKTRGTAHNKRMLI